MSKNKLLVSLFLVFSAFYAPTVNVFAQNYTDYDYEEPDEKEDLPSVENVKNESDIDLSKASKIAIPQKKDRSYFALIPRDALSELEKGSPSSIKNAVSKIKKGGNTGASYTNAEKTFIKTATSIMQIVWPSVAVSWDTPNFSENNPYLGAVTSARQGVYDSSTGNSDFLTLTLPSLVLLTTPTRKDYYEESLSALEKALELKSDSVLANYLMGVLLTRLEKYEDALPYFIAAHSETPDLQETVYMLADCQRKTGNLRESYILSSGFLLFAPQNKTFLKMSAETCFEMGDYINAEQFVSRVLQQEPENTDYILFRARILVEKKDYIKASSLLDVYARTDTSNRTYLILRTKIQTAWNRNIAGATQTLEQALSIYPDDEEIILLAASLISGTGNKIAGLSSSDLAEKILKNDPSNTDALQIQIKELVREKKWSEAYKSSSELLRKIGTTTPSEAVFIHIDICLASKKTDEAFRLASSLYSQDQKNENTVQSYIKVLVATGKTADATRLINQLLPNATTRMKSFLYYERSLLATSEEQILAELRSSLTSNPRNQDSLFRLYEIYFQKREFRKAQYYLRQVVALSPNDEELLALSRQLETLVK